MTPGTRRTRLPATLLAALAALLVFAAAASAETRTGESSTFITEGSPSAEATIVHADASYDTSSGSTVLNVTTAGVPNPLSDVVMIGGLTTSSICTTPTSREALLSGLIAAPPPLFVIENPYAAPTGIAIVGSPSAPVPLPVVRSVSGATTTLSVTAASVAGAGFNCVVLGTSEEGEAEEGEVGEGEGGFVGGAGTIMSFPLGASPAPPAPPAVAPSSAPPAPAPAPPVLSISKLKPVTLKAGKSKSIKVKVTNTGATGTGGGSLRVRAPKGVLVKPERQQLPVLAAGKSWTLTVRVQLTAKAKKKSTLSLIAAASGVTASGSLAIKLKE
jgi:hypothetical protein